MRGKNEFTVMGDAMHDFESRVTGSGVWWHRRTVAGRWTEI